MTPGGDLKTLCLSSGKGPEKEGKNKSRMEADKVERVGVGGVTLERWVLTECEAISQWMQKRKLEPPRLSAWCYLLIWWLPVFACRLLSVKSAVKVLPRTLEKNKKVFKCHSGKGGREPRKTEMTAEWNFDDKTWFCCTWTDTQSCKVSDVSFVYSCSLDVFHRLFPGWIWISLSTTQIRQWRMFQTFPCWLVS